MNEPNYPQQQTYQPAAPHTQQPQMPPYQPIYRPAPAPKITYPFEKRDLIFALLIGLSCIFWVNNGLFDNFQAGYAVVTSLLFLFSLIYLFSKHIYVTFFALFCTACVFAALPVFAIYCDSFSKFWLFCAVIVLSAAAFSEYSGASRFSAATVRFLYSLLEILIIRPFDKCGMMLRSVLQSGKSEKKKQTLGILIGVLCAVPFLAVILPLLISSDAAFEGLLQQISFQPVRLFGSLILGFGLFLLQFSLLFSLRKEPQSTKDGKETPLTGKLPAAPAAAFLGVISLVYLIYLFSQTAYFIGGFSGILPEDFTLASYARRGFFEMCAVCALNLIICFLVLLIVRKENGKPPVSIRVLSCFLCVFSLALIGCALAKMFLYVDSFGMTRLRICTSVFMVMLAFIFLFAILRIFIPAFPYMKAAVIAVAILGLVTAWADIDTVIARYNTEAYFSGKLSTVDVSTLGELSDASVPYLLRLAKESKDDIIASDARYCLTERLAKYCDLWQAEETGAYTLTDKPTLSGFNLTRNRAQKLLLENRDLLEKEIKAYQNGTFYDRVI